METGQQPGTPRSVWIGQSGTGCSRVRVAGRLDAAAADALSHICEGVLDASCRRLELDLSDITGSTPEGVSGLARCLLLGQRLPGGLGVTVANDYGRRALLDSLPTV